MWKQGCGDLIKKKKKTNKEMGKGSEIVPRTEQVRKNVKVLESTGF